jgi:hypothetical protein
MKQHIWIIYFNLIICDCLCVPSSLPVFVVQKNK